MKKSLEILRKFILFCFGVFAGIYGYAQETVAKADSFLPSSAYHFSMPTSESKLQHIPVAAIIFGSLFVLGIYALYHFISNGALRDDMSDAAQHQ